MPVVFAIHKLRNRAKRLQREYEALCVITNMMTREDRDRFAFEREMLEDANKVTLQGIIKKLERAIRETRHDWGFRAPNSDVVKILEKVEQGTASGQPTRINKSWVSDICSGYDKYWKIFRDLPEHTLIEIDSGATRDKRGQISWYLLEASVYEDMCASFNRAKELEVNSVGEHDKISFKTHHSLLRATVLFAFHFVEAYLNGLAFDYYASTENRLNSETYSLLFDWNSKTNKPRYLSLREKALQYPKIILGVEHPPVTEDNCPELKAVLEAVEIRHRLTHISPKRELDRALSDEQASLYSVRVSDVEHIVDSCIALVRKIDVLIHGETLRLHWLHDRTQEGPFPTAVFD